MGAERAVRAHSALGALGGRHGGAADGGTRRGPLQVLHDGLDGKHLIHVSSGTFRRR